MVKKHRVTVEVWAENSIDAKEFVFQEFDTRFEVDFSTLKAEEL